MNDISPANELELLMRLLARLPGLGARSARRIVLKLVQERDSHMVPLMSALELVHKNVGICSLCGNIDTCNPCMICTDKKRDPRLLCVVEDVAGIWALERAGVMRGFYHVLGGVISAIEGRGPEDLNFASLQSRVFEGEIEEVILAIGSTVEGQTTAHYVAELLSHADIRISRLAQGVPLGGELDYLDDGTLSMAFRTRQGVTI